MDMITGFISKRFILYILAGLLMIALSGCGAVEEDETTTSRLSDDFSSYSGFPETPWTVIMGNDANWTITTESANDAARFYPASADSSYLQNSDYSSASDASVMAKMKIVAASAATGKYGLYLRASDDLSSYYALIFDIGNALVYIYNVSGSVSVLKAASWAVSSYMTGYHTYQFSLSGSDESTITLKAYVDDELILTAADSSPITTTGQTGFFFTNVSDGYITSYQVTEP